MSASASCVGDALGSGVKVLGIRGPDHAGVSVAGDEVAEDVGPCSSGGGEFRDEAPAAAGVGEDVGTAGTRVGKQGPDHAGAAVDRDASSGT